MKTSKLILTVLVIAILFSCKTEKAKEITPKEKTTTSVKTEATEKFKEVDFSIINDKLAKSTEHLSPQDIMRMYYPLRVENGEGNEKITISERKLSNEKVEVTLIHDNFMDDSVKGEKHIMVLNHQNGKWTITTLRKNWKCYRGHKDWGVELCD